MTINQLRSSVLFLVAVFCVFLVQSQSLPYDTIVCFGDSDSDTGNVYKLTGSRWPPPPYYLGRFSNGPVWVEKFSVSNLLNYAYSGATSDNNLVTGTTAFNTTVPGVRQQINIYKNTTDFSQINFSRTLYIIWASGNDYYFNPTLPASVVVNSLINRVKDLVALGGKNILIGNQSPLQAYPALLGDNMNDYLNTLTLDHNRNLSTSIQILQNNFSNISFYLFDVYSLITNILVNSSAFGINNITNCWSTTNGTIIPLCTDPNTYLFIDEYHFTTRVHQFIADRARTLFPISSGIINSPLSITFYLIIYLLSQ